MEKKAATDISTLSLLLYTILIELGYLGWEMADLTHLRDEK